MSFRVTERGIDLSAESATTSINGITTNYAENNQSLRLVHPASVAA